MCIPSDKKGPVENTVHSVPESKIFITSSKSLIPYAAGELTRLGYALDAVSASGIALKADRAAVMRLNLQLRTAHHVLYHIKDISCTTAEDLYREVFAIPWEELIDADTYISVQAFTDTPSIRDSRYANMKCKDAIVDRMMKIFGRRPDSGPLKQGAVIAVYWRNTAGSVYIDTSGEVLAKRGYRKIPWKAPLPETLAAGIIYESAWTADAHFINPMCGSGTLAIEAALMGLQRAPGLLRSNFGLLHCKLFDPAVWQDVRAELSALSIPSFPGKVIASDNDPAAIDAARKNARTAGVEQNIEFIVCDFEKTPIPAGNGVVILNPDYGIRLGVYEELELLYKNIGKFFKHSCAGYRGFVFTGNPALGKKVGLRSSKKTDFLHAGISCRLHEYELYEGSKSR